MLQISAWVGLLTIAPVAVATGVDDSMGGFLRQEDPMEMNPWTTTAYGKSKCPCVGIDKISGYYATNLDFYHIQYALDTGTSCNQWDLATHPLCEGGSGPDWCFQRWCYVDPCNCETEGLPGMTNAGVEFQGGPAYWSYETCGFLDLYSKEQSPDACITQMNVTACDKLNKCAWDGKRCGGKKLVQGCQQATEQWDTKFGEEDCRCIGLSGRENGAAWLNINDEDRISYPADVGAYCDAWEVDSHPDCKSATGEKPPWCHSKWCFVDPCKCNTKSPARIVMPANQALKFQGKSAYWSSETCGSEDSWTASHGTQYCVTQQSQEECNRLKDHCSWVGAKGCVGKALAGICSKQQDSGMLGFEEGLIGSAQGFTSSVALLVAFIGALA